jgi:hypothetical protein
MCVPGHGLLSPYGQPRIIPAPTLSHHPHPHPYPQQQPHHQHHQHLQVKPGPVLALPTTTTTTKKDDDMDMEDTDSDADSSPEQDESNHMPVETLYPCAEKHGIYGHPQELARKLQLNVPARASKVYSVPLDMLLRSGYCHIGDEVTIVYDGETLGRAWIQCNSKGEHVLVDAQRETYVAFATFAADMRRKAGKPQLKGRPAFHYAHIHGHSVLEWRIMAYFHERCMVCGNACTVRLDDYCYLYKCLPCQQHQVKVKTLLPDVTMCAMCGVENKDLRVNRGCIQKKTKIHACCVDCLDGFIDKSSCQLCDCSMLWKKTSETKTETKTKQVSVVKQVIPVIAQDGVVYMSVPMPMGKTSPYIFTAIKVMSSHSYGQ